MSRLNTTFAMLLVIFGTFSGKISQAEPLSHPPFAILHPEGLNSLVDAFLSLAQLPLSQYKHHQRDFVLKDGTKINGLLFIDEAKGPRPLIIADFGLMSSRWSRFAGEFVKKLAEADRLDANLLVMDDVSSPGFYAYNGNLSLGGYDAGRILVMLAEQIEVEKKIPFTSLHLLGESLGGLAVAHAIIEDQRLGTHHFQSAITFSGVIDQERSTGSVFTAFKRPIAGMQGPKIPFSGKLMLDVASRSFNPSLRNELASSGAHYQKIGHEGQGEFFYEHFQERLSMPTPDGWNPAVQRDTVENYLHSSAALMSQLASTSVPIILVHAQNDPIVDFQQFQTFVDAQNGNSRLQTLKMRFGSHCGFIAAYGTGWVADLVNRSVGMH